jgi:hypothetical protein
MIEKSAQERRAFVRRAKKLMCETYCGAKMQA